MPVRRNRKPTNRNVQHFVPCTNEQVLIRNINDTWDPEKKTVIIDDLDEQYIKYFVFDKIEERGLPSIPGDVFRMSLTPGIYCSFGSSASKFCLDS